MIGMIGTEKMQLDDCLPAPLSPWPQFFDLETSPTCRARPAIPAIKWTIDLEAPASSEDERSGPWGGEQYEDTGGIPLVRDMLTDRQRMACETVYQRAARMTEILLVTETYGLLKRCQRIGLDFTDMERTMEYLAWEAPIIIHFRVKDKMLSKLLKDTNYRNLFETGASNGNPHKQHRRAWEDRVFGYHYQAAKDDERPKYGVLNPSKDPRGFKNIWDRYGDSYMVVKNSPRLRVRCTLADRDTSDPQVIVTDFCDWKRMILLCRFFTDDELIDVTKVATGKKSHGDSTVAAYYKEVQIHGPVRLKEDIAELVLHPRYKEKRYIHTLEKIKEKHGIAFSWMKLENEHKKKLAKRKTPKKLSACTLELTNASSAC